MPKKGFGSVGVAPQNADALGENANCLALLSLTLARREVSVMVDLGLLRLERWTSALAHLDLTRQQLTYFGFQGIGNCVAQLVAKLDRRVPVDA